MDFIVIGEQGLVGLLAIDEYAVRGIEVSDGGELSFDLDDAVVPTDPLIVDDDGIGGEATDRYRGAVDAIPPAWALISFGDFKIWHKIAKPDLIEHDPEIQVEIRTLS